MLKFDTWAPASLPQLKRTLVLYSIVLTFIAAIIITLVCSIAPFALSIIMIGRSVFLPFLYVGLQH